MSNHCIKAQNGAFDRLNEEGRWCQTFTRNNYRRWFYAYQKVMDDCRKNNPEWFADIYSKDSLQAVYYWNSKTDRWEVNLFFEGHGKILWQMTKYLYHVGKSCDDCWLCDRFMDWLEC